jgi:NADH-quinone oxidoreductase subunit M
LKLGGYGMVVFLLSICKKTCFHYTPFIYVLIIISIIYGSMAAIAQTDLKRIVAYSSIAHMNLAILGVFSSNSEGLIGSIFQMISHGIISAGLFFLIGFLYDRFHTRDITYYGGLTSVMPVYSTIFFFFTIANMGFPGTSAFVGELLIFVGSYKHNTVVSTLALAGAFLSAVYSV